MYEEMLKEMHGQEKVEKAGAELGQAQLKLGLDFNSCTLKLMKRECSSIGGMGV